MTKLVEAAEADPPKASRPRLLWAFAAFAVLFLLAGGAGGSYLGKLQDVQKNDNSNFLPSSADSTKVANEQSKFASVQSIPAIVVYQRTGGLTAADKRKIVSDVARFGRVSGVAVDQITSPEISPRGNEVEAVSVPLVGKRNGKFIKGPDLVKVEKHVLAVARAGAPSGLAIHGAGAGAVLTALIDSFSGLDGTLLIAAGLVVVLILLVVYRSPVLWFFPLFCSIVALGAAAIVIYALAKNGTITLNGQSQGILSVLVIGAGTDYALLLVSRYREELQRFESRVDAMISAWKGAAPPIIASGLTVILGLMCLTFARLKATAGLGPVCAIGIACTLVVMLTTLPVLLVAAGRWIFWPKRPTVGRRADLLDAHGPWGRFSTALAQRHRRAAIGAGVLLLACVAGVITLRTSGLPTEKEFTDTPDAIVGQHLYESNFGTGGGVPAVILADVSQASTVMDVVKQVPGVSPSQVCVQTDYAKVAAVLKQTGGVALPQSSLIGCPPQQFQVRPHAGKILIDATLTASYDSSAAYQTIGDIRAAVGKIKGAPVLVGGQSAVNLDVRAASQHDREVIIPLVLLVILIVLGLVLRALVAPVLLIATVVLSFGAALGVSAFFFNHVFHFANADPGFPLFSFVFLVALGIDYNIFLMTRVREESLVHGTHDGIIRGLAVTGGVITSAGAVLAATFVVLSVLPIVFLAEIGFAVAFGVLLDTVVVRSILVPALSHEFGRKIWWPSALARADPAQADVP